ncbi:helix-turn-helix domain-containing protein [Legionella sp. CNM-4043-24]|uniref:helix-turn-helix domain-containing protein n=1 Tax=Legionella sp. CNM-4043-24 TaxID=3421646 RepID=UPI00403A8A03
MNTTAVMDNNANTGHDCPGAQLARVREKKGFTQEYVAVKLHLRVRIIELLEADDYLNLPEPVFIKGYLRAYAKLLGVNPEPYLQVFNNHYALEKKPEKALWQSRRESHTGERLIRWITGLVAVSAIVVVSFWWQKNKDTQPADSTDISKVKEAVTSGSASAQPAAEPKLSALSRMQSMFTGTGDEASAEKERG